MMANEFTLMERHELLKVARDTIEFFLEEHRKPQIRLENEKYREKRGVFVTLHRNGELRGCIGYPLPVSPLLDAIMDNAISAAFRDPRFPEVEKKEFPEIDIEISVLTVPERVESINDILIGRDGIIISRNDHRGLLLPQVPLEQGWDLDQYLSYGCMKAGLPGDEWRRGVEIEIFRAEVFGEMNHE
jgi:AmmeMemoRadiSam system protein A